MRGPIAQLSDFLTFLNDRYPTIEFTMEIGRNPINFLELSISLDQNAQPTFTDIPVHASSYCSPSHKAANINFLINRLLSVPLSDAAISEDIFFIQHVAHVNALNFNVAHMVSRNLNSRALESTSVPEDPVDATALPW